MLRLIGAIALIATFALVSGCTLQSFANQTPPPPPYAFVDGGPPPQSMRYRLSGPYACTNMVVYLVHAEARAGGEYLSLQQAMRQRKVVVDETGEVNTLAVRNHSDDDVYVQAGEIVKGGQQDRTLADDMILPARSSGVPICSFCVEHGRWSGREGETSDRFGGSPNALISRQLKLAARLNGDQSGVWSGVDKSQQELGRSLHANPASATSPTSLQLTLENPSVQNWAREYTLSLGNLADAGDDVVGYACIINGELSCAEVYATHALFKQLWGKLLTASAMEAIALMQAPRAIPPADTHDVNVLLDFLRVTRTGRKQVSDRTGAVAYDSERAVMFETRDTARPQQWVHRCYLAK